MNQSSLGLLLLMLCQQCAALELNQAGEAELDGLRGIGPPFTRRLLAAREKGLFTDWQDLRARVKGMGPKLSQSLSDQGLTVNGEKFQADKSAEKITQ
jgi:competence protein ComEA